MSTEPHPLDYGRPELQRRPFIARPFYRDYVVACVLISFGLVLADHACVPPENLALQIFGATLAFAGFLIFVLAIGYSIWFVVGGKPPRNGSA
jgi:hypothetical protein